MILSQLVDADELNSLSPEELREMLARLDDEVVYGAEGANAGAEEGETQENNAK